MTIVNQFREAEYLKAVASIEPERAREYYRRGLSPSAARDVELQRLVAERERLLAENAALREQIDGKARQG